MKKNRNRAMALVVVLSVVVILSLIVVSLTVAMRMERQAAFYFSERSRADLLVKEGVESAKMILADSLGDTNKYVVSMPGRLMVLANGSWETVNLSSGLAVAAGAGPLAPPDLNRTNKTGDGLRQIDPLGGPMILPWVYVYEDGTRSTAASPAIDRNNPIIGRYAFWADDESTRVNLNTAWKRNINYSSGHPTQVAVQALSDKITDLDAEAFHTNATNRPLQSLSEASRLVSSEVSAALVTNRFFASPYNHSPAVNPWGEPKIYLTTQLSNLPPKIAELPERPVGEMANLGAYRSDYYLDILPNNNVDPGSFIKVTGLNYDKLGFQMRRIVDLLSRTNWPLFPGKSFAQKYYGGDSNRVAQLALDIVDYVRSVESTNETVTLIRLNSEFKSGNQGAAVLCSTSRHPVVTELGLWFASSGPTNRESRAYAEVYLPPEYGIASYSLIGDNVQFSVGAENKVETITADMVSHATLTPSQPYSVITSPPIYTQTNNPRLRVVLSGHHGGDIYEVVPNSGSLSIGAGAIQGTNSMETLATMEVDDPRNNKHIAYWKKPLKNTLGTVNTIWKTKVAVTPPQDLEGNALTDYSLFMPRPKGSVGNEYGRILSVAELGRIASGINHFTNTGVGWRTLRLQPTAGSSDIPDWALFDLFAAVPKPNVGWNTASGDNTFPSADSVAGRINLNTQNILFSTNRKIKSLDALVPAATGLTSLIPNIAEHKLTANSALGASDYYRSAGELVDIAGFADSGSESSEDRLKQIVDLATVRSGVYRVFCVGQSIKQTPTGELKVNAAKSVETLIESQGNGSRFRSVSWRESPF